MYRYALAGFAAAALSLAFISGGLVADDEKKADKEEGDAPEISTTVEKVSYGIGQNIGGSLVRDELELDIELLILGLKDALSKQESRVTEEELEAAFQEFQATMQERQLAKRKELEEKNMKEGDDYLKENGKKKGVVTTDSGLQYEVIAEGDGPTPKKNDRVKTHYHGTLIDGTVFDSSVDRDEPAVFGVNQVIKGWTEALQLMKVGDKWRIVVPADLAYGARGAGKDIGPNATLIFEIELLGIEKEDK